MMIKVVTVKNVKFLINTGINKIKAIISNTLNDDERYACLRFSSVSGYKLAQN